MPAMEGQNFSIWRVELDKLYKKYKYKLEEIPILEKLHKSN